MTTEPLFTLDFRLTLADCDPIGIVYFGAYYPWMERTYAEWTLHARVPGHRNREQLGMHTVIRSSGCEYLVAGTLYDALRCELRCEKLGRTSYRVGFDFVRPADNARLAHGFMHFVCVGPNERPVAVPALLTAALAERGKPPAS